MITSLRALVGCVADPAPTLSVAHDLYGYTREMPRLDITIHGVRHLGHSLVQQARLLHGEHVLNLDVVHVTVLPFDRTRLRALDRAVAVTRGIYAQVGLGVARVAHGALGRQDAERYETITSRREARSLCRRFRGPHDDALDLFMVRAMDVDGIVGLAFTDTPCNKDVFHADGCIVAFAGTLSALGVTVAHEVAHCLGLGHVGATSAFNLMLLSGSSSHTVLSDAQGGEMRAHCFVRAGC